VNLDAKLPAEVDVRIAEIVLTGASAIASLQFLSASVNARQTVVY